MTLRDSFRKNWPELKGALLHGLPGFVLARRPADLGQGVPVFCYHVVDVQTFSDDLAFLRRNGYTTIDAGALLDHLEGRHPAPPRAVVLSFDDGAANLYEVVFPMLRQFNQKAVAFVAPRFHAHRASDYGLPSEQSHLRPCTWPELRRMHESGLVDIQSHTLEHRYVPWWPTPCELTGVSRCWTAKVRSPGLPLDDDLRLAKQMLEEKLGKTVEHLAFPQFDGTGAAVRVGQAVGYRGFWWGVLCGRGARMNRPGESATHITRISGDLLRRLPGEGRCTLRDVLAGRTRRRHARQPMPTAIA